MTNQIIDTQEMAEAVGFNEDESPTTDMAATEKPTGERMEFFVQMRGYTLREMEDLIIEAAARQIVGARTDNEISRKVQDRALEMISDRIDKTLKPITTEILDQPMYRGAYSKGEPITMREYIGLVGREFLTERVDNSGKSVAGTYNTGEPRVKRLVAEIINKQFGELIKAEMGAIRDELKKAAADHMEKQIAEERKRIADALGYEIKAKR